MKTLPGSLTRQPNCSSSGLLFAPRVEVIQFSGSQLCRASQVAGRVELLFGGLVHLVQVRRERDMSIMGGRGLKAN